jgi:hypothetical protein
VPGRGAGFYYNTLLFIGFRRWDSNPPFLLSEHLKRLRPTRRWMLAQLPGALPNPAITAVQTNMHNGLSQQWNLTVERAVSSDLGLRVSYVGNKTNRLPYYNEPINVPYTQVPGALQANRPYQPWADILYLNSGGDSRYTSCRSKRQACSARLELRSNMEPLAGRYANHRGRSRLTTAAAAAIRSAAARLPPPKHVERPFDRALPQKKKAWPASWWAAESGRHHRTASR